MALIAHSYVSSFVISAHWGIENSMWVCLSLFSHLSDFHVALFAPDFFWLLRGDQLSGHPAESMLYLLGVFSSNALFWADQSVFRRVVLDSMKPCIDWARGIAKFWKRFGLTAYAPVLCIAMVALFFYSRQATIAFRHYSLWMLTNCGPFSSDNTIRIILNMPGSFTELWSSMPKLRTVL